MTWISIVRRESAEGRLRALYDRVAGPEARIDNILLAHGLRPHTLEGHVALYKSVLHHAGNALPRSYLETLGVYVSLLNGCRYCVEHHMAGLRRLLDDPARADAVLTALADDAPERAFEGRELAGLAYAEKLTRTPNELVEADVAGLRAAGFDDGEILEINQVVAYFAYANRTVLGLGVSTDGDVLGLSPSRSDAPDDWSHR